MECQIRSEDPRVSRLHARLIVEGGDLWIEDLGSANGVFVGPHKVARAQVPNAEVIIIGSLMLRLLASDGTLPPPLGVHGTLAHWLIMERRARVSVEAERDAFASRVGELHADIRALVTAAQSSQEHNETASKLEAALAQSAALQNELQVQVAEIAGLRAQLAARPPASELAANSEVAQRLEQLELEYAEATAARNQAEQTAVAERGDAARLRNELEELKKFTANEAEALRLELAQARESAALAETSAGVAVAERLAVAERTNSELREQLVQLQQEAAERTNNVPLQTDDAAAVEAAEARAAAAEKRAAAAEVRAQGAERNLAHATTQAATADLARTELQTKIDELTRALAAQSGGGATASGSNAGMPQAAFAAGDSATSDEKLKAELEEALKRLAAAEKAKADAQAAKTQAEVSKSAAEAAKATAERKVAQLEAERKMAAHGETSKREVELVERVATLEKQVEEYEAIFAASGTSRDRFSSAQRELDATLADAEAKRREAEAKLAELDRARASIQTQVDAAQTAVEAAQKRADAAEAMSKSMAKDVADSLRRAVEADAKVRQLTKELAALQESMDAERRETGGALSDAAAIRSERDQLATALAAERRTALDLVERKTALEREIAELEEALAAEQEAGGELAQRFATADNEIEDLQDRITDLESQIQVDRTAAQLAAEEAAQAAATALAQAQAEHAAALQAAEALRHEQQSAAEALERALRSELAEAKQIALETARSGEPLRAKLAKLEAETQKRQEELEAKLRHAEHALSQARHANPQQAALVEEVERLRARVEAGDLAVGKAAGLQRQLDEALTRLARLEQATDHDLPQKLAAAEARAAAAEAEVRAAAVEAEARAQTAVTETATTAELDGLRTQLDGLRQQLDEATTAVTVTQSQCADLADRNATLTTELESLRAALAEAHAAQTTAEAAIASARADAAAASARADAAAASARAEAAAVSARVDATQHDGATAELASLEAAVQAAEATAAAERRAAATALADAQSSHARELAALRTELAAAQRALHARAASTQTSDDRAATSADVADTVAMLEEAIDSLRANMRAASDETAQMAPNESVVVVATAVEQAAEHLGTARAALRRLNAALGLDEA